MSIFLATLTVCCCKEKQILQDQEQKLSIWREQKGKESRIPCPNGFLPSLAKLMLAWCLLCVDLFSCTEGTVLSLLSSYMGLLFAVLLPVLQTAV